MNILLAFMETLTVLIIKLQRKPHQKFSFLFPSLLLVDFLHYPPLIRCRKNLRRLICHRRLSKLFSGPQEAARTNFIVIGGFLNAATSSLKRVTGMIFRISGCFHRSSQTSDLGFFTRKQPKKFLNHQRTYMQKVLI
jgi:hypothetical protein